MESFTMHGHHRQRQRRQRSGLDHRRRRDSDRAV